MCCPPLYLSIRTLYIYIISHITLCTAVGGTVAEWLVPWTLDQVVQVLCTLKVPLSTLGNKWILAIYVEGNLAMD